MPKVLVFSQNKKLIEEIAQPLKDIGLVVLCTEKKENLFDETLSFAPDIAVLSINGDVDGVSKICRKLRLTNQSGDMQIILVLDKNVKFQDISQVADGYISAPVNPAILVSTVNAHLRLKSHLDIFSANNNELAQRFYQLKVLYDTNSRLAGTLSPRKLINIMNEGLDQSISYSVCLTLLINNNNDATLIINSLYPLSKRLEQALKLRTITSYRALFPDDNLPFDIDVNDLKTEINYKNDDNTYDFEIMRGASLFSPISVQDKFFGTVEILREEELSQEDTTCFQTVVSQVALPLESAILYEEIQEKNERLTRLEKLKSEFVSIVSHELRTPLTSIKNSLDVILSGKTGIITEKMSDFLSMGKRNVTRLAGIINDLLDLSKIEAGKMEYRFEKINLLDPVNLVISTFMPTAAEKEINLVFSNKTENPLCYADSQKIEQVLSNLISNALKFTNPGGKVSVFLTENKKASGMWQIQIKDTGIGICEENLPKVFDKFRQIENSLSRKVGGTGLGLPIAKELILSHGGDIWAESREGKGTSFYFTLPKYDEYTNFLTETNLFFDKSKSANTNFGLIKIKSDNAKKIQEFVISEGKTRKIFNKEDDIYIITQNLNKNLYEVYLEKLKEFATKEKNDNILISSAYCDFSENPDVKLLIDSL